MNQPTGKSNSKRTKVILIIIVCAILWCVAVYLATSQVLIQNFESLSGKNPDQTALIAEQIADFELPPGFSKQSSSSMMGFDMIMISNSSGQTLITLMQFPGIPGGAGLNADFMLTNTSPLGKNGPMAWNKVDVMLYTIRGEKTAITIYENQTLNYNAWACDFEGKSGPAMLMIMGPKSTWDNAAMEAFINSIR